jgi:hypothetical protein
MRGKKGVRGSRAFQLAVQRGRLERRIQQRCERRFFFNCGKAREKDCGLLSILFILLLSIRIHIQSSQDFDHRLVASLPTEPFRPERTSP